jgi:hypothetical protein
MLVSYQLLDESKCVKINQQHNFFKYFQKISTQRNSPLCTYYIQYHRSQTFLTGRR